VLVVDTGRPTGNDLTHDLGHNVSGVGVHDFSGGDVVDGGSTAPTTISVATTSAPDGLMLQGVSFVDASHGWLLAVATGNQSRVVEASSDGGMSWHRLQAPAISSTGDVYGTSMVFATSTDGYVATGAAGGSTTVPGPPWLFVTHDGGGSWQPSPIDAPVVGLEAGLSEDWAVTGCVSTTYQGCVHRLEVSTDRGRSWVQRSVLPGSGSVGGFVRSGSVAWVYQTTSGPTTETASLLSTVDGGTHWSMRPAPCKAAGGGAAGVAMAAFGAQDLWFVSGGGPGSGQQLKAVCRSVDGGQRWQTLASDFDLAHPIGDVPAAGYVGPLAATSDRQAWMGLSRGDVEVTVDRGATWKTAPGLPDTETFPAAIQFLDALHGWIALNVTTDSPDNGIYRTTDGGRSWQHVPIT